MWEKDDSSHPAAIFVTEITLLKSQEIGCVPSHLMMVVVMGDGLGDESLLCKYEDQNLIPRNHVKNPSLVTHFYNPSL